MDPYPEYLERWRNEYFASVVSVNASSGAERACRKNNLALHEILSAFSSQDDVDANVRWGSQSLLVRRFNVRFERAGDVRAKSAMQAERLLASRVTAVGLDEVPPSAEYLAGCSLHASTPPVENLIMSAFSHCEVEMVSQPQGKSSSWACTRHATRGTRL
jgi:hypothetical protein